MAEIVRSLCYRDFGHKVFGGPVRPVPEGIGPAATGNSASRKTTPGSHRRKALTLHGVAQMISSPEPLPACVEFRERRRVRAGPGPLDPEKRYRGKRKSTRVACSTPLSSILPSTITKEPSLTSSIFPGFPSLVHSFELS